MEEKILCVKCNNWVGRKLYNNLHQICCTFIDNKPPHVAKVLDSDDDWRLEISHVLGTDVVLKPWQLDGVRKLLSEHFADRDTTILADEMGLGKTLTTLVVMMMVRRSVSLRMTFHARFDRWTSGVYLIVGPKSTSYDVWDRQPREYIKNNVTILHYKEGKRGAKLHQALLAHVGGESRDPTRLLNGTWKGGRNNDQVLLLLLLVLVDAADVLFLSSALWQCHSLTFHPSLTVSHLLRLQFPPS